MKWWKFFRSVKSINPERAKEIMDNGKRWTLLDVREPPEYAEGHIEGAVLIPLFETSKRAGELEKERAILVYCRSGSRSKLASRILAVKGFDEVYNIEGGILAWQS